MGWIASRLLMLGMLLAGIGIAAPDAQRFASPDAGPGLVGEHAADPRLADLHPGLPSFEAVRPARDGHEKATAIPGEIAAARPSWRLIAVVHHDAPRPLEPRTIHPLPRGPPVA
jgi:hypothetical protein